MLHESIIKLIRQIEILGLACGQTGMMQSDLAEAYGVSNDSIKKDVSDIKKEGIQIFSQKHQGIIVEQVESAIAAKIDLYLRLRMYDRIDSQAINNLVNTLGQRALYFIVAIYKQIEGKRLLNIDYLVNDTLIHIENIKPLSLWLVGSDYRFIGRHDGILKQYCIGKIQNINFDDILKEAKKTTKGIQNFLKIKDIVLAQELLDLQKYSISGWVNANRIKVEIEVSELLRNKVFLPDQAIIHEQPLRISAVVNSLEEFAKYIIAHSGQIKAINPPELIEIVKQQAQAVLDSYE